MSKKSRKDAQPQIDTPTPPTVGEEGAGGQGPGAGDANPQASSPRPQALTAALPPWAEPDPDRDQPTVALHLPVAPVTTTATLVHLEVRLSREQSAAFRSVREALRSRQVRLACGRAVERDADVLRFVLDLIADKLTTHAPGRHAPGHHAVQEVG